MYEFMHKYAASAAACHRMSKQRYAEDQSLTQDPGTSMFTYTEDSYC